MRRTCAAFAILIALSAAAFAASGKQPAPSGAAPGAPPQYTRFSTAELERGFLALAFGSDLHIGATPRRIHRFENPIRAAVINAGRVDRTAAMQRVIAEYAEKIPSLHLSVAEAGAPADIEVHLIDEKHFAATLQAAFGAKVTRSFIARTNPQCMTSVKSDSGGAIEHATMFIIADKGDAVFLDCAYHELLHAFGLSNHDQRNPWTTLNQKRTVGYLTAYDRALLTLLYDPALRPDMTEGQVRALLPGVIMNLRLANSGR